MERIGWVRALIDHANDPDIDAWWTTRGSDRRRCLWFREEFLVVLAKRVRDRDQYWQLITAYDTPQEHRKRNLRRERDAWRVQNG